MIPDVDELPKPPIRRGAPRGRAIDPSTAVSSAGRRGRGASATRSGRAGAGAPALLLSLQRAVGNRAVADVLQRTPGDGGPLTGPVSMVFDGENLVVSENGVEVTRFAATSGRPTRVKSAHALRCRGSVSEVYVNNPRYVAVEDHGAIPEGTYRFRAAQVQQFTENEQTELIDAAVRGTGNIRVGTPRTRVHTGDWGRGRVPLHPASVEPGPAPCTGTRARSGFYLHGGIIPGSAGCIDIGSRMDDLAALIAGNPHRITLRVDYARGAGASLSRCELMIGEIMYDDVQPGLAFVPCFLELTSNADPEAQRIFRALRSRFLGRLGSSGGAGTGAGPSGGAPGSGTAPGGATSPFDLGAALRRLLGG